MREEIDASAHSVDCHFQQGMRMSCLLQLRSPGRPDVREVGECAPLRVAFPAAITYLKSQAS